MGLIFPNLALREHQQSVELAQLREKKDLHEYIFN